MEVFDCELALHTLCPAAGAFPVLVSGFGAHVNRVGKRVGSKLGDISVNLVPANLRVLAVLKHVVHAARRFPVR